MLITAVRELIELARRDLADLNDWNDVLKWSSYEWLREWIAIIVPRRKRG